LSFLAEGLAAAEGGKPGVVTYLIDFSEGKFD